MGRQLWPVLLLICQLQLFHGTLLNCSGSNLFCPQSSKQLACELTKSFDSHCGPQITQETASIIKIDGNLRDSILQYMNVVRDITASGFFKWKAAKAMPLLTWDPYLEEVSTQMAYHCSEGYQYCSNSDKYPIVTTTMIRILSSTNNVLITILDKLLPVWFNDLKGCIMNEDKELVRNEKHSTHTFSSCVGHFIPLITDRTFKVGCAASIIGPSDSMFNISLLCSFSKDVYTYEPYVVGSKANEGCNGHQDFIHKNLCNTNTAPACTSQKDFFSD